MDATQQQNANAHLGDLMKLEEGLTAWEITFIESLHAQEFPLTERQIDVIYKLYDRLC